MPSPSSFLSFAGKIFNAASPPLLPPAAASYGRCFSAKATKATPKPSVAPAIKGKAKPPPAAPAEKKAKKSVPQTVYKVSSGLSSVLQVSETTRPEALKRFWIYVKTQNLQSASDKTQIVCDPTLKKAFGQDSMKFTEVLKLLNPHLTKKV